MKKLIGLTGKARAGKTTVANYLWVDHGFVHLSFAGPLKMAAKHIFGLKEHQLEDESKELLIEHWKLTPRQMFQKLGTEAVRNVFGNDTWVKRMALSLAEVRATDDVVISDVRFPEEAEFIVRQGGVLVEIVRRDAGLSGAEGGHASENHVIVADYVLDNNSTVEALQGEIDLMLGKF